MKTEATSSMIEVLAAIWQRVLQLQSVQVDDDFFDLGGDSSLALQLFNEIAELCHRESPLRVAGLTMLIAPVALDL